MATSGRKEAGFAFDAFISYRRADATGTAMWLFRSLRRIRTSDPCKPGRNRRIRVYLDRIHETATPDLWERDIRPRLDSARWLIVLNSSGAHGARAHWMYRWIAE